MTPSGAAARVSNGGGDKGRGLIGEKEGEKGRSGEGEKGRTNPV
jgi:hypothetical protein